MGADGSAHVIRPPLTLLEWHSKAFFQPGGGLRDAARIGQEESVPAEQPGGSSRRRQNETAVRSIYHRAFLGDQIHAVTQRVGEQHVVPTQGVEDHIPRLVGVDFDGSWIARGYAGGLGG